MLQLQSHLKDKPVSCYFTMMASLVVSMDQLATWYKDKCSNSLFSSFILWRCVYSSVDIVAGQMIIMLIVFTISSPVQHSCTVLAHYYCWWCRVPSVVSVYVYLSYFLSLFGFVRHQLSNIPPDSWSNSLFQSQQFQWIEIYLVSCCC